MKEKDITASEVVATLKDNCVGFFIFSNPSFLLFCVSLVLMSAECSLALYRAW